MAGKTGTAQVVSLSVSNGKSGPWKYRDHGLFIFFAPYDNPRYAGAVVIEHGGGSGAAYPIARDVMTFLFDPAKGLEALAALEAGWGAQPSSASNGAMRPMPPSAAQRSAAPRAGTRRSSTGSRPRHAAPLPKPMPLPSKS